MSEYVIPIHGIIGKKEHENDVNTYVCLSDLSNHLENAKNFDTIILDIDSKGGNCNEEILIENSIKALNKNLVSRNSGNVASAASRLFCLAPTRTFDPSKGKFLPHNPWGEIKGDSETMQVAANMLKAIEVDYELFYSKQTGAKPEVISQIMAKNQPLTNEEIESNGFAKIQIESFQAVATFNFNQNNEQMTEQEKEEMKTWGEKINAIFSKFFPKAIMVADAGGNELEFPDIKDASEIAVGVKVNVKGTAFSGESLQSDGTTIIAENGIVAEIKPVESAPNEADQMKVEIEALKNQLAEATATATALAEEKTELSNSLAFAKTEFEQFRGQFSAFVEEKSAPEPNAIETNQLRTAYKN